MEELDRSVEAWINSSHPNGATISHTLLHIAKFLAEYCRMYETSPPPFLRLGMEKRFFNMFNIPLELKSAADATQTGQVALGSAAAPPDRGSDKSMKEKGKKKAALPEEDDVISGVLAKPTPVGNNVINLSKQDSHLYLYYRWMWVQFPWLGMPSCSKHLASLLEATVAKTTVGLANTNHNIDKLLASSSLNRISTSLVSDAAPGDIHDDSTNLKDDSGELMSPTLDANEARRREVAGRSWKAKKQDPAKGRVVSTSANRTAALIKAR